MRSCFQSHTVSRKSGSEPTEASMSPLPLKLMHENDFYVPFLITRYSFKLGYSWIKIFGHEPFSATAKYFRLGWTAMAPIPPLALL